MCVPIALWHTPHDTYIIICVVYSILLITEEILEVTYSYWDGSGHRRVIKVRMRG